MFEKIHSQIQHICLHLSEKHYRKDDGKRIKPNKRERTDGFCERTDEFVFGKFLIRMTCFYHERDDVTTNPNVFLYKGKQLIQLYRSEKKLLIKSIRKIFQQRKRNLKTNRHLLGIRNNCNEDDWGGMGE